MGLLDNAAEKQRRIYQPASRDFSLGKRYSSAANRQASNEL